MNRELKAIFGDGGIVVGNQPIPTAHLKYEGKAERYIVWSITGTTPALSGDDEQLYGITTVDVDIYCKDNYLEFLAEVKRLMKLNEWIWTEDSPEMYEEDTGLYHITASFEKEREL